MEHGDLVNELLEKRKRRGDNLSLGKAPQGCDFQLQASTATQPQLELRLKLQR